MDVKVGDEVRVFEINGKRSGQPEGGYPGRVTRVGRVLFTVDWPRARGRGDGTRGDDFRLDTFRWNNKDFGSHYWVRTLEQVALDDRKRAAMSALTAHGFRPANVTLSLVQLEELVCMLPVIEE